MKNYAKVGKQKGRPAFRTQASFRYRKCLEVLKIKPDKKLRQKLRGVT